jgi:hypothetical protein
MAEFARNKLGSRQIALLAGAISKFFQSTSYNVMNSIRAAKTSGSADPELESLNGMKDCRMARGLA